jgi:hypothetical protein
MPPQARFILCRGLQKVSGLWTLVQLLCIDNVCLVGSSQSALTALEPKFCAAQTIAWLLYSPAAAATSC